MEFWQKGTRLVPGTKDEYEDYLYYQIPDDEWNKRFWFLRDKTEFLLENGFNISAENMKKLEDVFDDSWVRGYYTLTALVGDDKENANKYLNLLFNYVEEPKVHPIRLRAIFKRILESNTPKDIFIPILAEYLEMGYVLPEGTDEQILDGYEWKIEVSDDLIKIVDNVLATNAFKLNKSNIDKMGNFIMGQVIKECKMKSMVVDNKKIKDLIDERISNYAS